MFAEFTPDPRAPLARRWRARDLLYGVGLLIAALAAVIGALGAISALTGRPTDDATLSGFATIGFEMLFGGAVLALARRRGLGLRELGFVRPRRWQPAMVAWGGAYVVLIAYGVLIELLDAFGLDLRRFDQGNPLPVNPRDHAVLIVLFGAAVLAVAPLCEELFFRGLLFRGLRGYWRLWPAAIVSGAAFGLLHLNPSVIVPFVGIGVLFAWATEASRSLWASIAAHAAFNAVSLALTLAGGGS